MGNYARSYAPMSVIGETIFVTGGIDLYDETLASVESFKVDRGWKVEEKMVMPVARYDHCSVVIGTDLFVIGGFTTIDDISANVMMFDTNDVFGYWQDLEALSQARFGHACQPGKLEDQEGIFVSGGSYDDGNYFLSSVEFYISSSNTWQNVGNMKLARMYHTLSYVDTTLLVAGGIGSIGGQEEVALTLIEWFEENEWTSSIELKTARDSHVAVIISADLISC